MVGRGERETDRVPATTEETKTSRDFVLQYSSNSTVPKCIGPYVRAHGTLSLRDTHYRWDALGRVGEREVIVHALPFSFTTITLLTIPMTLFLFGHHLHYKPNREREREIATFTSLLQNLNFYRLATGKLFGMETLGPL